MVEGIGNTPSPGEITQLYSEYEDVEQALMKAFPDKSELEIQKAVIEYMETLPDKDASEIDSRKMLDHITKLFNVEISTQAATEIKKELEDLTHSLDIDVSDLASILEDYSPKGLDKTNREYLILLWQQLQSKLEDAIGEESTSVGNTDKEMQQKEFKAFVDKKAEEMAKAGETKVWNKLLKWVGVVAAVAAAAVACVVAAAAIASGAAAPVGALLIAGAGILVTLAVAGAVSATLDEFGVKWSLGQGVGKGIGMLINALGGDVDEEQVAMWTAFGVQMALTIAAVACTLGAGLVAAPGAVGSFTANAVSGASKTVNAINQAGTALKLLSAVLGLATAGVQAMSTVANYQLALTQATLLELKALLEKLAETRNTNQELMAAILSKIFESMRGSVGDSMDTLVQDMKAVAGMNLNKA